MVPPCQIQIPSLNDISYFLLRCIHFRFWFFWAFPWGLKYLFLFFLVLDGPSMSNTCSPPQTTFRTSYYAASTSGFDFLGFSTGFKIFISFLPHSWWSPHVKYMFPSPNHISYFLLRCIHFWLWFFWAFPWGLKYLFLFYLILDGPPMSNTCSPPQTTFCTSCYAASTSGFDFFGLSHGV